MMTSRLLVGLTLAGVGCSSSANPAADGGGGPLKIVALSTTVGAITSEVEAMSSPSTPSAVQFVAIVTDDAGLDAIAGGSLTDESGATYGAFGAGANKGTYTASLSWTQITQVRALDFPAAGETRMFTATFFDNLGRTATASVPEIFFCGADRDHIACTGACEDQTRLYDNCGRCGTTCSGGGACYDGACVQIPRQLPANPFARSACIDRATYPEITTCSDFCERAGGTCYSDNGRVYPSVSACQAQTGGGTSLSCTGNFATQPTNTTIECYCTFP